ncbi:MAG: non-homologous end-joining DNA ligase [Acidobacteria bacterium]|nr:non-homologous end-joining DNA ligase [Acidobacteriota bacterium]
MMATRAGSLPDGSDWSYEVKWDGYRAQVIKSGDLVALASRNLKDITRQFPAIAGAVARMPAQSAILDGEIVALDREGRPSFQALHHWSFDGLSLVYYAFDLLHLNGRDLTKRPLDERRAALRTVVDGTAPLLLSEPLPGKPQEITEAVRRLGLEGVVAKKRRSTYTPGRRSEAWIKVRFAQRQELVIGGYKPTAAAFDSLLVGYYEGRKLMCAGKVRNGFTPALRAQVFDALRSLETPRVPFANLPSSKSSHWGEGITLEEMRVIHWLKPVLVAEVSFAEWTRDGSLRHAAFIGLRDDKPARSVVREG